MVTKKQILAKIQELEDFIKSDEFEQLKRDSEELKQIKELLSSIKFKVKDIKYFEEDNKVIVVYELPKIELEVDEEGNVGKNDFFYACNKLELVSLEDTNKLFEFLYRLKK